LYKISGQPSLILILINGPSKYEGHKNLLYCLNRLEKFLNIGDKNMKYSLFATALIALFLVGLVGCGDPKPGQYPPSFMDERDGAPPAED